jgi:hypothetical protein
MPRHYQRHEHRDGAEDERNRITFGHDEGHWIVPVTMPNSSTKVPTKVARLDGELKFVRI